MDATWKNVIRLCARVVLSYSLIAFSSICFAIILPKGSFYTGKLEKVVKISSAAIIIVGIVVFTIKMWIEERLKNCFENGFKRFFINRFGTIPILAIIGAISGIADIVYECAWRKNIEADNVAYLAMLTCWLLLMFIFGEAENGNALEKNWTSHVLKVIYAGMYLQIIMTEAHDVSVVRNRETRLAYIFRCCSFCTFCRSNGLASSERTRQWAPTRSRAITCTIRASRNNAVACNWQ